MVNEEAFRAGSHNLRYIGHQHFFGFQHSPIVFHDHNPLFLIFRVKREKHYSQLAEYVGRCRSMANIASIALHRDRKEYVGTQRTIHEAKSFET